MTRRSPRKAVDRLRHKDYQKAAEHFYEAAKVAMEYCYWTAAGVLIVHSAIAYADAVSIKLSAQKSSSESHEDAIALVEEAVAKGEPKRNAINQLRRIIAEKTKVSYAGDLYGESVIRELWKKLERFRSWAIEVLER